MVSTNKMVQLNYRFIQFLLLCIIWELGFACSREHQYSSVRIHAPSKGQIALLAFNVIVGQIGKKLDKGYKCPVYCDVAHKHLYWENNEAKEGDIQTDHGIHRSDKPEDREQSESDLRPIASTD